MRKLAEDLDFTRKPSQELRVPCEVWPQALGSKLSIRTMASDELHASHPTGREEEIGVSAPPSTAAR
jgi:hypothetical protein